MIRVVVTDPKQLGDGARRALADMGPAIQRGIMAALQRGRAEIVGVSIPRAKPMPFDTGFYARSWKVRKLRNGASLMNDAPYAGVIEYGRRPGGKMPPVDVIAAWIHHKGLVAGSRAPRKPYRPAGGIWVRPPTSAVDQEVRSVAFLIARAIRDRGMPPKYILTRTIPRVKQFLWQEIENAVRRGGSAVGPVGKIE